MVFLLILNFLVVWTTHLMVIGEVGILSVHIYESLLFVLPIVVVPLLVS